MRMAVRSGARAWVARGLVVAALLSGLGAGASPETPAQVGDRVESFDATAPTVAQRAPQVRYDLDGSRERFFIHVPKNYTGREAFGLVVYCDPGEQMSQPPPEWDAVLARRKLLLIAPQQAGNNQDVSRRLGLAVLAAVKAQGRFKIDSARVYAAGLSGGARMAGLLGLYQPDVFRGTIQSCGADFYEPIAWTRGKPRDGDTAPYGVCAATADQVARAKAEVRFVFITGDRDFRSGYIRDIYDSGYAKAGFAAKLIDVPGMEHTDASGAVLDRALSFIERADAAGGAAPTAAAEARAPTAPAAPWASKPTSAWPQVVLSHNLRFKDGQTLDGASAFLFRLPNGAVVAGTAGHLFEGMHLAGLDAAVGSWTMSPRTMPQRKVTLGKLATRLAAGGAEQPDAVIVSVDAPRGAMPVEVLVPREEPVRAGETVYVIAVQYGEKGAQSVYKGTVSDVPSADAGSFLYDIDPAVDTRGFSGAPVVDASGRLIGMHLGYVTLTRNGQEQKPRRAMNVKTLLNATEPPPPAATAHAAAAEPVDQPAKADATAAPKQAPAPTAGPATDQADKALGMAKNYLAVKKFDLARAKLQHVIDTYPGTRAAKEAQTLLAQIQVN